MNEQEKTRQADLEADPRVDDKPREPGLLDASRFLYRQRKRLAIRAMVILAIGTLAFFYYYFSSPKTVGGSLSLSFRGIEKSEYPSGKRFTVEDFRSPVVLTKALADAGVSTERVPLQDLIARVYVTPVIPGEIQSRWKNQDQQGILRDEYSPSEFNIDIGVNGLTDGERLRLFDGIIRRYQEAVKYDQKSAKGFVNAMDTDYDKLSRSYDPWDIPDLFRQTYTSLREKLTNLITESTQYHDSSYQLALRKIAGNLDTWERMRLEALEALTYQGRLVKNREIVVRRIQYRIQDLTIQIQQKSQEASEGLKLLEVIEQPKEIATSRESSNILDAGTLDKLIKSDYVGPVVERISNLQGEVQTLQADKSRLEKQLSWLPKAPEAGTVPPPAGYQDLTSTVSREINEIVQNYDRLLDDYLTATITSLVAVKQAPVVSRLGYAPALVLPAVAMFSIFIAIVLLGIEHLFGKARREVKREPAVNRRS